MQEPTTVTCPNCQESATIYVDEKTCEHCGEDIGQLQRQHAQAVRDVLNEIREMTVDSQFTLEDIRKQKDVIKLKFSGGGEFELDDTRIADDEYDIESVLDRQEELEDFKREIDSIEGVSSIETWLASQSNHYENRGSKFGMEPTLEFAEDGTVVLLIGTNV